jgi:uncharacterized membrane protein YkoI
LRASRREHSSWHLPIKLELIFPADTQKTGRLTNIIHKWSEKMIKRTAAALITTAALFSAGAAMADRPGAGWITIERAIEIVKTKAGYVEVYEVEADNDGYWKGEGRKADGVVYEFRIDGASGNVLRDQKD